VELEDLHKHTCLAVKFAFMEAILARSTLQWRALKQRQTIHFIGCMMMTEVDIKVTSWFNVEPTILKFFK